MVEVRKSEIGPQWRIAEAERMRQAMGPGMCAAFDALREMFAPCQLCWLDTPTVKRGTEPGGVCTKWDGVRRSP